MLAILHYANLGSSVFFLTSDLSRHNVLSILYDKVVVSASITNFTK